MGIADNAGKGAVQEAEKIAIPEIEAAAKRVIDYALQQFEGKLDAIVQKYAKVLAGLEP